MSVRPYSYIDLGSDEVVGKRRVLDARGYNTPAARPVLDKAYRYIDEGTKHHLSSTTLYFDLLQSPPARSAVDALPREGLGEVCNKAALPYAAMSAPPQHYRFLDVGADELRGTFISPARSEERLLYQEASWRLGFDRGYSAHYLLPPVRSSPQNS